MGKRKDAKPQAKTTVSAHIPGYVCECWEQREMSPSKESKGTMTPKPSWSEHPHRITLSKVLRWRNICWCIPSLSPSLSLSLSFWRMNITTVISHHLIKIEEHVRVQESYMRNQEHLKQLLIRVAGLNAELSNAAKPVYSQFAPGWVGADRAFCRRHFPLVFRACRVAEKTPARTGGGNRFSISHRCAPALSRKWP